MIHPTRTLSLDEPSHADVARVDHFYLILAGGKAGGGARWSLGGIDRVEIGRGAERGARRTGTTLRVDCPDPWMSTCHVRFEREGAHWIVLDADSRNGTHVNGAKQDRAVVLGGDIVDAGRSFFALHADEPSGEPALELPACSPPEALATLDPELAARFSELRTIATTRVPVLIGGGTGTGKERVARAIHAASGRRGEFVAVNCAALAPGVLESELFGHRRGAFSGAVADAQGLIAASAGGTLFLDEIAELAPPAQAAVLRVLEAREVRPVGSTEAVPVDLRVVSATHRDLAELVATGGFREDLLARLDGASLELPALAERRVDLGAMLGEIVIHAQLAAGTVRALLAYAWPRNMRELVRVVERAVALADNGEITPAHLPAEIAAATFAKIASASDTRRDELVALLEKHHGNVSEIARELGRVRQQVQKWLKRYGLDPARYR
jgi:transcriptional regulator with PAS, ATPase and Fis domain